MARRFMCSRARRVPEGARLYGRDPLASRMAGHSQASGTLDETPTIGVFDVDSKLCRSTI